MTLAHRDLGSSHGPRWRRAAGQELRTNVQGSDAAPVLTDTLDECEHEEHVQTVLSPLS